MELNFTKQDDYYVANFEANSNFNLHLEHNGVFEVYQSSVEGAKPAIVKDLFEHRYDKIVDTAVLVPIPPIYVRIVCNTLPSQAVVNFGA